MVTSWSDGPWSTPTVLFTVTKSALIIVSVWVLVETMEMANRSSVSGAALIPLLRETLTPSIAMSWGV